MGNQDTINRLQSRELHYWQAWKKAEKRNDVLRGQLNDSARECYTLETKLTKSNADLEAMREQKECYQRKVNTMRQKLGREG